METRSRLELWRSIVVVLQNQPRPTFKEHPMKTRIILAAMLVSIPAMATEPTNPPKAAPLFFGQTVGFFGAQDVCPPGG